MAKKQFKSESKRLLDLMINSIYTHKEIFLRELISNASDAIDKLCFISLTDDNVGMNRSDFNIRIKVDSDNRTLTISDNGIGMDKEDLDKNLGTIASSGSLKFKESLENKEDSEVDIIGQFGVGFYSAFMVSDKIQVITKKYGSETAYIWESSGVDGYTINEIEKDMVGTTIILTIKEDTEEENYSTYLDQYRIEELVKKYSDYIRYPIIMDMKRTRMKENSDENAAPEYEDYISEETLNDMIPIWRKNKKEVSQDDYDSFYREKFFAMDKPARTIVTSVEGVVTYKALLFIPSELPFDYYTENYKAGLQLYTNGVMIMENCEELLPDYLRFVKGVVDSDDISLNISREMLQHDYQVRTIAKNLEKKVKHELKSFLQNDRKNYEKFFEKFGKQLKYGIISDYGAHKEELEDIILFYSSKEQLPITLAEYMDRMKEDQNEIYYATGKSLSAINSLPQTELLNSKGYEIIFCTDQVDEFVIQSMNQYKDMKFKSVLNDDLDIDNNEDADQKEENNDNLINYFKMILEGKVDDVIVSKKLVSHPVCLTAKGGMSFEMEEYFNTIQPGSEMKAKRILEINSNHKAIQSVKNLILTDKDKAEAYVNILYNQALLIAGLPIDNPTEYTDMICSLME